MTKTETIDLAYCKSRPGINAIFSLLKKDGYHKTNRFFSRSVKDGRALEEIGLVEVVRTATESGFLVYRKHAVCLLSELGKEIVAKF